MRIFKNCMEAIKEIERDLFEMGIEVWPESMQDVNTKNNEDFKTKELMGYAYCILDGSDKDEMLAYMKLPLVYAEIEFQERMNYFARGNDKNPGKAYLTRYDVWSKFLHDGKFAYTYNERLHEDGQFSGVIEELSAHPNTRQAIVQIFDFHKDLERMGGRERIPCSILYQFMIREGAVHVHYYQRSGDFLTHLAYDIWFAIATRDYVASSLSRPSGALYHYITSLHAYYGDLKKRGIL
jgi:thymidylate synthase